MSRETDSKTRSADSGTDIDADPWNAAITGLRELDVARYPTALLLRVANAAHFGGTAIYARKHGLTLPQWRLLHRLQESGPLTFPDLCRISWFDKAQASRVLSQLDTLGLVSLTSDPAHLQRRIVAITDDGRSLANQILPDALAEQHRLLNVLDEEERSVTYRSLLKLLASYGYDLPSAPTHSNEEAS